MKCPKHGCKMVVVELGVGWGNESRHVCPECRKEEQEKASASGQSQIVFSAGRAGWQ